MPRRVVSVTEGRALLKRAKPSKYGAKATVVDNIRFASKKEARRYQELRVLEKAGKISGLRRQTAWSLRVGLMRHRDTPDEEFIRIGEWRSDFDYCDRETGKYVIEDVKGFKTPLYRWKKKHVEAQYGIQIRET